MQRGLTAFLSALFFNILAFETQKPMTLFASFRIIHYLCSILTKILTYDNYNDEKIINFRCHGPDGR